ncbi:hypothetical protein Lalb_Chr07g0184131 [Lupinus albus]|uniref:Uncharacterized protein n=1 Tax=Lupinus albus TaxID=3870 RepID=A0A6A4Q7Q0_LUPAL|nr:hypothetical protein Lalb_Chr07g0184131 [Lupinus albus]
MEKIKDGKKKKILIFLIKKELYQGVPNPYYMYVQLDDVILIVKPVYKFLYFTLRSQCLIS